MKRIGFLKSLAGVGASTFGLSTLSSFSAYNFGKNETFPEHLKADSPDFNRIREDFPRVRDEVYMDNASTHPTSIYTAAALHRYTEWAKNDVGEPWWPAWSDSRKECKNLFAKLINADPSEIAFARSTITAENNMLNGMNLKGGNVVMTDLHYTASIHGYKVREQRDGLDIKIIKHQDWQFDVHDFEPVVNRKTKVVAITLVSNVNGFVVRDVKAISDLAHANGAILYADIIQGVGAVPVDVRAMGIDVAACSTFKWLMGGGKGFGFFYVRKDLQGTLVKTTLPDGGVSFNYAPWVDNPDPSKPEIIFAPATGPEMYEVSYPNYEGVIAALQSLKYILELGVDNIRAHSRTLNDRLAKEMPRLGYSSITPAGNESPIIVFQARNPKETMVKLKNAKIHVAMRFGNKMRISPSVFNNMADIDRLLEVLS